jgi:hypothetical protein
MPPPTPLKDLARTFYGSLRIKPGMVCAARMKAHPYTLRYGKAGHGIGKANLAGGLGNHLRTPAAGVQEWNSDNCAEVEAAHKILSHSGLNFGNTGGIEFCSIDSKGNFRTPCLNCKTWVNRV